jgi:uncharacterized protein YjeT (DUF2065 family)
MFPLDTMFAVKMLKVIVTVLVCLSAVVAGVLGMIMFPFAFRVIVDKMYEYSDDELEV